MKWHPWWLPRREGHPPAWARAWQGLLALLLGLWLVLALVLLLPVREGGEAVARAGAVATSLLAMVLMVTALPCLVGVAALLWMVHRARQGLPAALRPWHHRARRWNAQVQAAGWQMARPVLQAYATWAGLRRAVGLLRAAVRHALPRRPRP